MSRYRLAILAPSLLIVIFIAAAFMFAGKGSAPIVQEAPIEPAWIEGTADGISFTYPEQLPLTYMRATDWPPTLTVTEEPLTCEESRTEIGETRAFTSGGVTGCVTMESEGAAGSVYTHYAYSTEKDERTVTLSFVIRSIQCANYDEPDRGLCGAEREGFDADALAARVLESVALK